MKNFNLLTRYIHLFAVLSVAALAGSCSKSEPYVYTCEDGLVNFENVKYLRLFQNVNSEDSLVTLVIKNEADYKKYIVDPIDRIDFSRKRSWLEES